MVAELISVLHFTNSVVRGGAEEHILTLFRQLDRKYFRLHLVCPPECAETLKNDLPHDVRLNILNLQKPYQFEGASRLARIIRENKIGIVHSHLFGSSLAASPIAWICRVPVVVETPHIREAWRHGFIKGHYVIDRFVSRFVDHYIAVSEANARYLIQEKGLPASKVHVIHNGCDLNKFKLDNHLRRNLRNSLGFTEENLVLLVLGRLELQKGHRFLLEAFAQVHRELPQSRLVCVGDGALREELQAQTRALQIQDRVYFVGQQANVNAWLTMADVSILPSLFEGLPLVAIESLAATRPIIATSVDGTVEVVVSEKTGLTVPPGDVGALAKAILRLLRNPELRQQLALAGRRWVEEHFSDEQQRRKTQDLYLRTWNQHLRRVRQKPIAAIPGDASQIGCDSMIEQNAYGGKQR
jgi:glycosyltransferase involved in cell wall biosynthesis